jgi:uncharacterized protein (TIGR03435 family)
MNPGRIVGHRTSLDELAANLAVAVERSVINKTGLQGSYDLTLTWAPDQKTGLADDSNGESIYTALQQQLGLKLTAARAPVEMVIVDSAERPSGE